MTMQVIKLASCLDIGLKKHMGESFCLSMKHAATVVLSDWKTASISIGRQLGRSQRTTTSTPFFERYYRAVRTDPRERGQEFAQPKQVPTWHAAALNHPIEMQSAEPGQSEQFTAG
jgi:hypothetical protein